MKIHRIALDLDDVLNSCTMYLLHILGCDVGPFDYHKFPDVGYDMVGAWAALTGRPKVDVGQFWEWISRKIWEDMPKSEQFWLLDAAANKVGRENVLIATSPTKSPDCLFGKYQWLQNHLPEWCHRQYSITPRKSWLAQPGVLLIDDCDTNCNEFCYPIDGRPGGDAILVPRPWNSLSWLTDDVDGYLADELSKRQGPKIILTLGQLQDAIEHDLQLYEAGKSGFKILKYVEDVGMVMSFNWILDYPDWREKWFKFMDGQTMCPSGAYVCDVSKFLRIVSRSGVSD